jgi:hypothetical protein
MTPAVLNTSVSEASRVAEFELKLEKLQQDAVRHLRETKRRRFASPRPLTDDMTLVVVKNNLSKRKRR